jgi:hypothetical protein
MPVGVVTAYMEKKMTYPSSFSKDELQNMLAMECIFKPASVNLSDLSYKQCQPQPIPARQFTPGNWYKKYRETAPLFVDMIV